MQVSKTTEAEEAEALVKAVSPHFAGKSAPVQGAALADLLALWLAGHVDRDDPAGKNSTLVREKMLELHLRAVRALIPINYRAHIEPKLKARRH
jgi:hypothetical protein